MASPSIPTVVRASARFARQSAGRRYLASHAAAPVASSSASSSSSSSSWSPPIAPGTCAAYDEALSFIASHQARLRRRIQKVEADTSISAEDKAQLLEGLTVASQIDDPKVRWAFERTKDDELDLADATVRHLRERAWRKCGSLDKLIERIRDQQVIPDSIPHITPTVDVQVLLGSVDGPGVGDHTDRSLPPSGDVLPGVIIEQSHLLQQPTLRLTSFSTEEKKHTVMLVDLDTPSPEGFDINVHWAVTDIPLSCSQPSRLLTPGGDLLGGKEVLPYFPPLLSQGSGRHRYVTLVFEQQAQQSDSTSSSSSSSLTLPSPVALKADLRGLIAAHSLLPVGIHFFRSEWTEASRKDIAKAWSRAGLDEPKWAKLPRSERKRRIDPRVQWAMADRRMMGDAEGMMEMGEAEAEEVAEEVVGDARQ